MGGPPRRRQRSRPLLLSGLTSAGHALETVDTPGEARGAGGRSSGPSADPLAGQPRAPPKRRRCGRCEGCLRDECGECASCLAKGGSRKKRRQCSARICTGGASGPAATHPASDDDPPESDGVLGAPGPALGQSLLVASAINQAPCPLCSSVDVERMGSGGEYTAANGGTELYDRYRCRGCSKEWNGIPPNRPRDRRPLPQASRACPECGKTFRRSQSLNDHMRRKHPTDAQAASYFLCQKCHEPFRTKAYCRDHQRLCTKTGDLIVCAVCGLAFHVAHHWTQHKAQTGHRGHTMRAADGAVVACGDDATATAVTLDDGVRFGLVRRLRCGEPPPLLFAEVVCAYRMSEEHLEVQVLGREQVARAAREGQEEEEEERVGWQRAHGSGAGGPSGDDDEEEEWDDSDEELYDATPDGPLRLPIVAGSPGWLQPGGAERQPENQQVLMEQDQAGLGEAVQVTAEELADEFF